jgi:multidrug efflux system membrane fusion protein
VTRRRRAATTLAAMTFGLFGACAHSDSSTTAGAAASASGSGSHGGGKGGKGGITFAVDVITVESKKDDYVVAAPGTLDAFEHVQVTARVGGVVDKVAFTEGQQVKKGDVLVVIESERYQLSVESAKALRDKAVASLADAEAMVTRREGTVADHPGLIPGEEIASYQTKVLTAKADLAGAAEALKIAQVNLRDAYLRAPMTGVMQTRTVETGQYVQPGYLTATLLRTDPMLLRFQVEPKDAPRLKTGMVVDFALRETQRAYTAKVTLVSGAAEAGTHTVAIVAEVIDDGHKYWLRPGSFCDVSIDIAAIREAPMIPRTAARATDHGYIVYVVTGDVATERPVTLGMNTKNGWVEVRSGLAAGEELVVLGAEALTSGAHVKANKLAAFNALPPKLPGAAASTSAAPGSSDAAVESSMPQHHGHGAPGASSSGAPGRAAP